MHRVGFLLIEGFALMSYAAAIEPLRAANQLAGRKLYDIKHLPQSGARATSSGGAEIRATAHVGETVDFDLVLVIAGGELADFNDRRVLGWLRHLARRGVTIGGVSGGPVVLAKAGVMTNRRLTVHWKHAEVMETMFPGLLLERSIYVVDRDRMTCAGGASALDMMHALIAGQHGAEFADRVSDWFVHTGVRGGGEPQRAGLIARYRTTSPPVISAIQAMQDHIANPLALPDLAARAGVGSRQLVRLFSEKIGTTPMAFYRRLRLDKARQLIQRSTLDMTEIALACGFAGSAHFSSAFAREYDSPPSRLRASGADKRSQPANPRAA